jgi:hypothetical protein
MVARSRSSFHNLHQGLHPTPSRGTLIIDQQASPAPRPLPINMSKSSKPYHRDLQFRGFAEGLTYIDGNSQAQCHYFGGVPYALPPVGPFRFQKPRSLPPCYRYGTKANPGRYAGGCGFCPQPGSNTEVLDEPAWDEDCLQTNIWIPAGESPAEGM